jgi:hypothetical protein
VAAIRYPAGGGASTLTALTDVTGTPGLNKAPVDDGSGVYPLTEIPTQESLDAILASVAHVDWRPLVLLDRRFAPFGQGYADPAWRLTLNNVVHMQGLVASSPPLTDNDAGALLGTLDADSWPLAKLLFGCPGNPGNNARFDVEGDGRIVFNGLLTGGGVDWFSISSISFSVGAAS